MDSIVYYFQRAVTRFIILFTLRILFEIVMNTLSTTGLVCHKYDINVAEEMAQIYLNPACLSRTEETADNIMRSSSRELGLIKHTEYFF